eukprot:1113606-Rhodomonas_salina.1
MENGRDQALAVLAEFDELEELDVRVVGLLHVEVPALLQDAPHRLRHLLPGGALGGARQSRVRRREEERRGGRGRERGEGESRWNGSGGQGEERVGAQRR